MWPATFTVTAERPAAILSYDEKPGIQAIATTAPDLPPQPSKHPTAQRDHEYKRLGTVTLLAVVGLVTGVVHHAITHIERYIEREPTSSKMHAPSRPVMQPT